MKLPNLLPNWISNRVADPEGTAPKGLVFKVGVILLALLMAVVIFLAPSEETGSGQMAVAPSLPPPAGPAAVTKGDQDIQSAADRRAAEQSRAERRKRQAVERARQLDEQFLREQSELEAEAAENRKAIAAARQEVLQQKKSSIRTSACNESSARTTAFVLPPSLSASVPQNHKQDKSNWSPIPLARLPPLHSRPLPRPLRSQHRQRPPSKLSRKVMSSWRHRSLDPPRMGAYRGRTVDRSRTGDADTRRRPGPAIARASTPFWSRDRQRILIPRGARFVGRVQAVQGINQSRLSVTFDRLIFNNYNIRMPFARTLPGRRSRTQGQGEAPLPCDLRRGRRGRRDQRPDPPQHAERRLQCPCRASRPHGGRPLAW